MRHEAASVLLFTINSSSSSRSGGAAAAAAAAWSIHMGWICLNIEAAASVCVLQEVAAAQN
jgi:hypothetical protein